MITKPSGFEYKFQVLWLRIETLEDELTSYEIFSFEKKV